MKFVSADLLPNIYNDPKNPGHDISITSIKDLPIIVANIIQLILIAVAVLAVIYITYAGVQYVVSQGDPQKTAAAKNSILNAIIGIVLSSSAYLLVKFVAGRFS